MSEQETKTMRETAANLRLRAANLISEAETIEAQIADKADKPAPVPARKPKAEK